jgi:hypothetical protein
MTTWPWPDSSAAVTASSGGCTPRPYGTSRSRRRSCRIGRPADPCAAVSRAGR